jgi:hypothetical protein
MTARLNRIHTILREANVPCALGSRPGLGVVLQAGTPDSATWDVLVRDTGTELLVQGDRETTLVPFGADDATVADTVKFHVVRAWADQGNHEAQALLAKLDMAARLRSQPANDEYSAAMEPQYLEFAVLPLLDPFYFAERMFDAMNQLGRLFMFPQPVSVNPATVRYGVWTPWGTIQGRYSR